MMVSWLVIGYYAWLCQWHPETLVIVQSSLADKSIDLVTGKERPGYVRTLYDQQDPSLQRDHPLTKPSKDMASDMFTWANGSAIMAIPSGGSRIRQYHPAAVFLDEAAYLPEAEESYNAADPVAGQIVCVSSVNSDSWFTRICERIMIPENHAELEDLPPPNEASKLS